MVGWYVRTCCCALAHIQCPWRSPLATWQRLLCTMLPLSPGLLQSCWHMQVC